MPVDLGANKVLLEPNTKIMRFDNIQWEVQRVVSGAILGLLYGDQSTKEQRESFYKSEVSRSNKQKLVEMSSQVYSYLDGTISEFADIDDYVFRVMIRITVDKRDGRIIAEPLFDVEIFKRFGKVSAKGIESGEELPVIFIGNQKDELVSPKIKKFLTQASREFRALKLTSFDDSSSAPGKIRSKTIGQFPTIIVEKNAYAVKLKTDGTNLMYIEDKGKEVLVEEPNDLVVFLTKKSGLQPEILGSGTSFASPSKTNEEITNISKAIQKSTSKDEKALDLIKSMKLDKLLDSITTSLASIKNTTGETGPDLEKLQKDIEIIKKDYVKLKVEYEVNIEGLANLEEKYGKRRLTFEQYSVERWKVMDSVGLSREALVDLQTKIKGQLSDKVAAFLKRAGQKGKN